MASLLEKVGVLIKANLHAMVDSALRQNSVAVIDQYVRQIEDNLEDLEDAVATVGGQVRSVKRRLTDYRKKAKELDTNIDLFLQEDKETLAVAAQSKLNSTKRLLSEYEQQLELLTSEHQKLMDAKLNGPRIARSQKRVQRSHADAPAMPRFGHWRPELAHAKRRGVFEPDGRHDQIARLGDRLAEIRAVLSGRQGGFLRDRRAPIHGSPP